MGKGSSWPGKSAKRVFGDLTRQSILFKKMDARAFASPKGLRPRRRVAPAHDEF
jgi:hypothetical protein